MRRFIPLISLAILYASGAHAQSFGDKGNEPGIPMNGVFSAPGAHPEREDHKVYRVDFKCKKLGQLPKTQQKHFFSQKTITSSHGIVVGLSGSPTIADKKLKVPEKPLVFVVPYELDGANVLDKRDICPKPFVIYGTEDGYIFPYASYSETNAPGTAFAAALKLADLVSPLFALFQPTALPTAVATKLTAFKDTKGPIEGIFSLFDKAETYGQPFPLKTGKYVVHTTFSDIEISVAGLDSIVDAKPTSLQEQFRKHIDSGQPINAAEAQTSCNTIAAALQNIGFSEDRDIPYALTYASTKLGSRAKMVECLGDDYTTAAIALGPVLWKWIPRSLTLNQAYIDDLQPTAFAKAKQRLIDLVVAFARIARGDPARSAEGLEQLKRRVTESVTIVDKTTDGIWPPPSEVKLPSSDIAARFTSLGFTRFGCLAPLSDANGAGVTSSVASLLAIKPRVTAADFDEAIQLQAVFRKGLISQLFIFNEATWVAKNASLNDGYCENLKLKGAVSASTNGRSVATADPFE